MIAAGPSVSALEIMRMIRSALREARDLTAAIHVLADRVDRLTGELAEGELLELTKLAAQALRTFETTHNGGRVP
jgi:hypothetical protein